MKTWQTIVLSCLAQLMMFQTGAWARPPLFVINSIADQTAVANSLFQLQAAYTVEDPTCWMGGISFSLTTAPSGMTVTTGGSIRWTPSGSQAGGSYQVTVRATAPTPSGSPCYGKTGLDTETFYVTVDNDPLSEPPSAAINVELTEGAMNNALAALTEVRGINFGEYLAGFVDAWWVNIDNATVDVLEPNGQTSRVFLTVNATASTVIDLFIFNIALSLSGGGWIAADVVLTGSPASGYTLVLVPTDMSLLAAIALGIALDDGPEIELTLGTELAPFLTCIPPRLVTNADRTALVLEWDVADLSCLPQNGGFSSQCVGVNYMRNDLGLSQATCAAYCSFIGRTCSESCTTNRGYPNWGVEAWVNTSQCEAYGTSGGQARCTTDLARYSNWGERKYRCCCQ